MIRYWLPRVLLGAFAIFALAQFVPYGRNHGHAKASQAARLPPGPGRQLFAGACGDCHSDQTTWPWYSHVAPVSWLVQNDVQGGRENFNVSHWDRPQPPAGEVIGQIKGGEMPPLQYKVIHAGGRLSSSERTTLAAWIARLYATDPPASTRGGG
jgi:mono/diheme cytochrome c family protein